MRRRWLPPLSIARIRILTGLEKAADEFLTLNNVSNATATVHVCNDAYPSYHDPNLCTPPANRRLVRVDATSIGASGIPACDRDQHRYPERDGDTSEAASLDIVLALDVSESMTWDPDRPSLMFDPAECNDVPAGMDHKLQSLQGHPVGGSRTFVSNLFPASGINTYDRIAVIPFDRTVHPDDAAYDKPFHLSEVSARVPHRNGTTDNMILDKISALRVYTASGSAPTGNALSDGSCLNPAEI